MNITPEVILAVINTCIAFGVALVNAILFLKDKTYFKWVRIMYAFDGVLMTLIQFLAIGSQINVIIGRGGATLVLTTILCSGLLTLSGGGKYDPSSNTKQ